MASDPASPETWPVKASASLSMRVPVEPAKVTDCALAPSITSAAPAATVTGGAAAGACAATSVVEDIDGVLVSFAVENIVGATATE